MKKREGFFLAVLYGEPPVVFESLTTPAAPATMKLVGAHAILFPTDSQKCKEIPG